MSNVFISENDPSRPAIWISWIFEDCLYCLHLCLFCHSCPGETSNSSNSTIQLMILEAYLQFHPKLILSLKNDQKTTLLRIQSHLPLLLLLQLTCTAERWTAMTCWGSPGGLNFIGPKGFSQHHPSSGIPTLRRSARPTGDFWVSSTKCWNSRFPGKPRGNGILTNTREWRRKKEQSRFSCTLLLDMRLVHFCGSE